MVSYVSTNRADPAEAVRSPRVGGEIVTRIFGSIDAYRQHMKKSYQEMRAMFGKLAEVERMPLGTLLELKLMEQRLTAEELGVNPGVLERVAREYLTDMRIFGLAYTDARQRVSQREIRAYEKALAQ